MSLFHRILEEQVAYATCQELFKAQGIRDHIVSLLGKLNLKELSSYSYLQLQNLGLTQHEAHRIISIFEIARRLETYVDDPKRKINGPEDVYRMLYPHFRESKKEEMILFCLNTKNQVIWQETVSIGSLNANIVHPREVLKPAILSSSAHFLISHNHPSGDPTPSREDIEITRKITESGKILGIDLLDHVIIGDGRHFSLKEAGHI